MADINFKVPHEVLRIGAKGEIINFARTVANIKNISTEELSVILKELSDMLIQKE